jgi:hypothetical protein
MAFLPLGKSVLPVVLMECTKAYNAIDAKVYHNGICISLGKVAEMAEHLRHGLTMWGLWLVQLGMAITARGLICGQVIICGGDGTFLLGTAAMLAVGDPAVSSPPASTSECGRSSSCLARTFGPCGPTTASAIIVAELSDAVYKSARMQTSSLLRH